MGWGGWVKTGTTSKIFPEWGASKKLLKRFDETIVEMINLDKKLKDEKREKKDK